MSESSLFLSSCSRREWARRRGGRSRYRLSAMVIPGLVTLSLVLAVTVVVLAGRVGLY
jgi:hypothetical protein